MRVTWDENVAIVHLSRVGFDAEALEHLAQTVESVLDDPRTHALVWTGEGSTFSVGADVRAFDRNAQAGTARAFVETATGILHPLMLRLHHDPRPQIAAINGVAAGGGLGLALLADARIGAPEARLAAGYLGVGLAPDGAATWVLPRLIGVQRTRHFLLDNRILDAEAALDWGLLDALSEPGRVLHDAVALAKRWCAWDALPRAAVKEHLRHSLDRTLEEQLAAERQRMAESVETDAFRDRVRAFVAARSEPSRSNA